MWRCFERRSRLRRARNYLRLYPRDEVAVRGILAALDASHPESARDAAGIVNGKELSEAEWASNATRWERAWDVIVFPKPLRSVGMVATESPCIRHLR
jgi:hypothetical protein